MERRRAGEGWEKMSGWEELEEKEIRDFILENCCPNCGEVWDCGGPDDPAPGGACEADDGEFDEDDDAEYGEEE
jgi:hypothetical protein